MKKAFIYTAINEQRISLHFLATGPLLAPIKEIGQVNSRLADFFSDSGS
jgi:hypothetical protein